jgi:hypothetical protein
MEKLKPCPVEDALRAEIKALDRLVNIQTVALEFVFGWADEPDENSTFPCERFRAHYLGKVEQARNPPRASQKKRIHNRGTIRDASDMSRALRIGGEAGSMSTTIPPCPFCGQHQDDRQMLVVETCDLDGMYIKCDSCGACGPVGYPDDPDDDEYDACDDAASDRTNNDARENAVSLWSEIAVKERCLRGRIAERERQLKKLAVSGAAMREAQKDYFRTRHQETLIRSKKLESDFDRLLKEATATEKQGSLL